MKAVPTGGVMLKKLVTAARQTGGCGALPKEGLTVIFFIKPVESVWYVRAGPSVFFVPLELTSILEFSYSIAIPPQFVLRAV